MNSDKVEAILEQVCDLAVQYYAETGKALGITGEMAEFHAAKLLGLELCDARCPGFDAVERRGSLERRIQVKGRCLQPGRDASPRMGQVDYRHEWDSLVLVLMDERFSPQEIWELDRSATERAFPPDEGQHRTRRGPSIREFKKVAKRLWPSSGPALRN